MRSPGPPSASTPLSASSPSLPSAGPPSSGGPDWIRETIALGRDEIHRFVTTALGFMRRPGRFSADWFAGRQRALNPLGFIATALGLSSAAGALTPSLVRDTFWAHASQALLPYVYYVLVGVLCHPILRLGGSTRPLRATIAVSLFAGGSPGLVVALSIDLMVALRVALFGPPGPSHGMLPGVPLWAIGPILLMSYAPFAYLLATLALGLAGLHAVSRARAAVAVGFSLVAIGLLFGVAHRRVYLEVGAPHIVIVGPGRLAPEIWF
jgi:hypothetical protein